MADPASPAGFGQGFVPGRHGLESYGEGGFRFADMSHRGSILVVPSGIYAWELEEGQSIERTAFRRVFDEADRIDILLVGTGRDLRPLPAPLRGLLQAAGISADPMATPAAARTYNVLIAEGRRVAAALIAVP